MRFGLDVPVSEAYADPRLLGEMAREAEDAGWDEFFLQDVLHTTAPVAEPWISLAAVALRTDSMRIGIMLTPLARRRPWQVARQAATIDHLSAGRLIFGAGLGFSAADFTPFGEEWDGRVRAGRLDEALEIVAGLWSGQPYSFRGEHYRLDDVVLRPVPAQSPPDSDMDSGGMATPPADRPGLSWSLWLSRWPYWSLSAGLEHRVGVASAGVGRAAADDLAAGRGDGDVVDGDEVGVAFAEVRQLRRRPC